METKDTKHANVKDKRLLSFVIYLLRNNLCGGITYTYKSKTNQFQFK